nr:unnamed protein product [Callosobruchus analis]
MHRKHSLEHIGIFGHQNLECRFYFMAINNLD